MNSRALSTASTAAVLVVLFDILWVVVVEAEQPLGYFALGAALLLGPALMIGLAFSWTEDSPILVSSTLAALTVWMVWGATSALVVGIALFLILRRMARRGIDPALHGVATATGLCLSMIVAPRMLDRLPFVHSAPTMARDALLVAILIGLVAGIVFFGSSFANAAASRWTSIACATGLLACAVLLPSGSHDEHAFDRSLAPDGGGVESHPSGKPNVLLIVLDTVRADHLSIYGYGRPTTPGLAAFIANRSNVVVFASVYSNSNWTVPSHASLFTGLAPAQHGAHFSPGNQFEFGIGEHATLAERMQDAGYFTIGVFANPWLAKVSGLERGFDVYGKPSPAARLPFLGEAARQLLIPGAYPDVYDFMRGGLVLGEIERQLQACGNRACFAFANLIDAHRPYVATKCRGRFADWSLRESMSPLSIQNTPERIAHLMSRYDEEICDLDDLLVGMLERLQSAGLLDRTWVFITADHGESFGDHATTEHGNSVYNEQTRIPLLVIPPADETIGIGDQPASLVDVTSTIAAIGGAAALGVGRDLRRSPDQENPIPIEFYGDPTKVVTQNPRAADPARSVIVGNLKLVEQSGRTELFDLDVDRFERSDLSTARPDDVARLRSLLPELLPSEETNSEHQPLSSDVIEQLRKLGYGQ